MEKTCILSDFDGTITVQDSLYHFLELFAPPKWMDIEKAWSDGKIDSKQCLTEEFALFPNLEPKFLENYINTVKIDPYFNDFFEFITKNNYDFFIVSDGLDYFINKILKNNDLQNIKVFANHAEFCDGKFVINFPNDNSDCKKNSGTCKCHILKTLKNNYDKIIYIGDGTSDLCVANKADILFAKLKLAQFCKNNNINFHQYNNFDDIIKFLK